MTSPVQPCEFETEPKCPSGNPNIRQLTCPNLLNCMRNFVYRDRRSITASPTGKPGGTNGLKSRHEEQANGECNPETKVWRDHHDQIVGQTKKLSAYGYYYKKNGCGLIPYDLLDYITRRPPSKDEWKGDPNAPIPERCKGNAEEEKKAEEEENSLKRSQLPEAGKSNRTLWTVLGLGVLGAGAIALAPVEVSVLAGGAAITGLGALLGVHAGRNREPGA